MESLPSVSPSIVLSPNNPHRSNQRLKQQRLIISSFYRNSHHLNTTTSSLYSFPIQPFSLESSRKTWGGDRTCRFSGRSSGGVGGGGETGEERENNDGNSEEEEEEDLERAIHLDGSIPGTSDEFVKKVSSRAYDLRRHVQQSLESTSYDVLEANPWRESSKPVYVLTQKENQLCTMKTRRNRSEVERELGQLLSEGAKRKPEFGKKTKQSKSGTQFRMLVEDVREGILVSSQYLALIYLVIKITAYC
ncbi:hypothetical protein AQUCO_00600462v1 [Aquilegia coerulea]|uniref:Uncharacterized protein n=1 Tax=Aquilegia coerulea TaxID=218851 RepID=A0A2G5EPZ1_AQUCA|nr:hypothetical protein AQUCO_00600462v1 [Aquilegia coerulea]